MTVIKIRGPWDSHVCEPDDERLSIIISFASINIRVDRVIILIHIIVTNLSRHMSSRVTYISIGNLSGQVNTISKCLIFHFPVYEISKTSVRLPFPRPAPTPHLL